jgi:glycosyltransferase involved in cell wall biosynthesis
MGGVNMIFSSVNEMISKIESPNLPVVMPTYNNPTYMAKMIEQLVEYGFSYSDIIILDNFSRSPLMREILDAAGNKFGCVVVKKFTNDGPREYYRNKKLFEWLPEKFFLTDPDIGFNKDLPKDFINTMIDISEEHNLYKVGFSLDIEMDHLNGDTNIKNIMFNPNLSMYQWEKQFWNNIFSYTSELDPVYSAAIDTTFCLVNKKFFREYEEPMQIKDLCARIGGRFIAQHYGWYNLPPIARDEYEFYLSQVPPQWSFTSNEIKRRKGL